MSRIHPGALIVVSFVFLTLTACGDNSHVFKYGNAQNQSDPRSVSMELFKTELERRTRGRIQVENYFGGILGTEREMADAVATGALQGTRGGMFEDASIRFNIVLLEPAVKLAEENDITLVVETGNNAMVASAYLGRKLIDDLATDNLKVLWDPANTLYCTEEVYPAGYETLRGGYLGHLHIKDCNVDIAKASVQQCALGTGQMAPILEDLAAALVEDEYDGVISLESVYHPSGGTFEEGFQESVDRFKEIFG